MRGCSVCESTWIENPQGIESLLQRCEERRAIALFIEDIDVFTPRIRQFLEDGQSTRPTGSLPDREKICGLFERATRMNRTEAGIDRNVEAFRDQQALHFLRGGTQHANS